MPTGHYYQINIPVGSEITFAGTGAIATIASERKVKYQDQEYSLTALTRQLLENDYNVQPGPHWFYNGQSLDAIYNATYVLP